MKEIDTDILIVGRWVLWALWQHTALSSLKYNVVIVDKKDLTTPIIFS